MNPNSNPNPNQHDQDLLDALFLYALQALPTSEMQAMEEHLSSCETCRKELETVHPVVGSFAAWPTDVLRPAGSLWDRLAGRIAKETNQPPVPAPSQISARLEWEEVAPGISCKLLATDADKDRVSMLVRLAPGTDYPPHRHAGVEELYLLQGELWIDDKKVNPGQYNRNEPGTADHRVWSETGCTCVLITSTKDALF